LKFFALVAIRPSARIGTALIACLTLAACVNVPTKNANNGTNNGANNNPQTQLNTAVQSKPLVLLGEVHDNAQQHAMRLVAFENMLLSGKRPALLMEQFDREHQAAIDNARTKSNATVQAIVSAGAGDRSGWNWEFYTPFLALAMKYELPIIAANVSNADAMRAMREGLGALNIQATPNPHILEQQAQEIFNGHCKAMPMAVALKMVNAQVAKDVAMAQFMTRNQALGVVLLAGYGHVRNDIGVPHWLAPEVRKNSVSIGLLESGQSDASIQPFDITIYTAPQSRGDPCEAFKRP
jgi:uncharacterized iron-regulated protein